LAVCYSAFAVNYKTPDLPCSWTFTGTRRYLSDEGDEPSPEVCSYLTSVNGHHMLDIVSCVGNEYDFMLVRDDLTTDPDTIKLFMYGNEEDEDVHPYSDVSEMAVPRFSWEYSFDYNFDSVVDDEWFGVPCKKYINGVHVNDVKATIEFLYVKDKFPIGARDYDAEYNFTFISTSDLKDFVASTNMSFEDDRVYSAPTTTTCQDTPSSSHESSSSSSEIPGYPEHYKLPRLPCAWTFTSVRKSLDDPSDILNYMTAVNGYNLIDMTYVPGDADQTRAYLIREDLGTVLPVVTVFRYADVIDVNVVPFSDYAELDRPRLAFEVDFEDIHFKEISKGSWYGVDCDKYSDGVGSFMTVNSLYVKDGFPIGALADGIEFNFTFKKGADLSLFAFDRNLVFKDSRCYTPPKESSCPDTSSSSSSGSTVKYKFPALPCAWTFTGTRRYLTGEDDGLCHYKTSVSGFLFLDITTCDKDNSFSEILVRDDFGTTMPEVYVFTDGTDGEHQEMKMSIHDLADMIQPRYYWEYNFEDFEFKRVEDSEWYGVPCKKYVDGGFDDGHEVVSLDSLYVKDGFPIGTLNNNVEFNYSFTKGANLSEFVFDRTYRFADQRVYVAPTQTYCQNIPSSSSSVNSSVSSSSVNPKPVPSQVSLSASSMLKPIMAIFGFVLALFLL